MTTGYEYLVAGQFILAFFAPFEAIGIPREFIMLLLLFVMDGLVYMKTQDIRLLGIVIMLSSGACIPAVRPGMDLYFYMLVVVGLAFALYKTMIKD